MITMNKINQILENKEMDALLVSDGYNMRYISGFRGACGYLYLTKKRKVLLTDSRYTTQAGEEAAGFEIIEAGKNCPYGEAIHKLFSGDGIKFVGFEDQYMKYADFMELKNACDDSIIWKELHNSLDLLRCIKTEEEQLNLEKAEAIGDAAFNYILGVIKPGMTELQVAAELEFYMKGMGAYNTSFDSIIASGVNSAMPHAMPSDKKLENGDFVTMDFGCIYDGYCSDMTRTIVLGKANDRQKEIYGIVLEAQLAALDYIRAGRTGFEVDKAARDIITKAGYGENFGHGLGHSVGLYIHEEPRLSMQCHEVLKENMIQTVEPGIYIPGFGGVRIEDMVIVKENGCKNLTHSVKELIEL